MSVRVVRLGTARLPKEGLRIDTVRFPPRGVPRSQHAKQNWYDVWLPELAPSVRALKLFSVGCYCAEEARCHRSVLRALLKQHGVHLE